jgi:hypothetical protein
MFQRIWREIIIPESGVGYPNIERRSNPRIEPVQPSAWCLREYALRWCTQNEEEDNIFTPKKVHLPCGNPHEYYALVLMYGIC